MIPKEIIDDVIQTARIEEVIGEFVNLKRAGSSLKGLSPFVDEKTPSFMVSPAKQIFKDFSSGKGGNVVSFVMDHEQFSYPEAIRWLAQKYNIEIPEEKQTPEQIAERNERESLYLVSAFAAKHMEHNLWNDQEGKAIGLSYFKERGFSDETIKKFNLGYCLNKGDDLTKAAQNEGYKLDYLVKAGLTKTKDDRRFDFFRSRVIFPIHNLTGRVLGFGGRTLKTDKKIAKYFNSPESEIYHKSNVLYGLYQAKSSIIKYDNCLLVEGYTDVISLHQSGVENVVASSGTALTKEQIRLIHRYSPNITILFDGDAAGIKASFRGIDMILEQGMNVKVVLFPDGEDPDSYSKKVSDEELKNYIATEAKDFITFKTELLLDETGKDPIKKAGLIRDIVTSISLIPDQITRSVYVKETSDKFKMAEQTLIQELNKIMRTKVSKDYQSQSNSGSSGSMSGDYPPDMPPPEFYDPDYQPDAAPDKGKLTESTVEAQEKEIIRILIEFGKQDIHIVSVNEQDEEEEIAVNVAEFIVHEIRTDELEFDNVLYAKIFQMFEDGLENNVIPEQAHFFNSQDQELSRFAIDVLNSEYSLSPNWATKHYIFTTTEDQRLKQSVHSAVYSFKLKKIEMMIKQIQEALKTVTEDEKLLELMGRQKGLMEARKVLSKEMGRVILK